MRIPILFALLLALGGAPAAAAPGPDAASARGFLQSIYRYYHKGGLGAPIVRPERWFEPALARAIRADMAESRRTGDIGKVDADFFCDCQDFEALTQVAIGPVAIAGGKAEVTVSFDNGGTVTMRYTLVWTRAGWRVFDIAWEEGALREMFFPTG